MVFKDETKTIVHGKPKKVNVHEIEKELRALSSELAERRALALALTLVIYSENEGSPESLDDLIGQIVERNPARVIAICADRKASPAGIDAWVLNHTIGPEDDPELTSEQVTILARGDSFRQLQNLVLSLRARELPMVLWWRAQPEPDDRLFAGLTRAADQIVLDSARFRSPAEHLIRLVRRMGMESDTIPFGDINWARLAPWRELVAQLFDTPGQLDYLRRLEKIEIEYSSANRGNPGQAMLLVLWLATQMNWQVVGGSWQRNDMNRQLRLSDGGRAIDVDIHSNPDSESAPCDLIGMTFSVLASPSANFRIGCAGNDCVSIQVEMDGHTVADRTAALHIPDEVSLVCYEIDSARRDRVYHRALEVLDQLIPQ